MRKELLLLLVLLTWGALIAYLDHVLALQTMLVETIHALVVTAILVFCLICQRRYPEIRQFGWQYIVLGVFFLTIGSWVDLLDDPPAIAWLKIGHVPFGRSWEQAFLKKIVGYTGGIGLMAYGFFQWIPWMIQTRLNMQQLNTRLSRANRQLNQIQLSLADHIESERLNISRELHDVIAQQLTALNLQLQLIKKQASLANGQIAPENIQRLSSETSDILKNVRQISQGLRPESLFSLGLGPAIEQFLDKLTVQYPNVSLKYTCKSTVVDSIALTTLQSTLSERQLLHFFRIIQELVQNALKHSNAKTIQISLDEDTQQTQLTVEDDGKGLPWLELPDDETLMQQGHLGLVGLQERAKELNATFQISSIQPQGVCAAVTLTTVNQKETHE